MVYFKDKICEIKNKLVKAIFYYITVIMLVLDPIYLCLLSGAFGGGDVNGILYLMPQAWIWTIFAFILLFNIWILLKKVNPTYTTPFKEDETKGENMESDIIKISHLNKSFGEVKAVNDLSFRVKKGELFAFLGVNGAGKSTTISILCGLLKKDSGTVQVNGIETDKAGAQTKRMLGVVFQDSVLDKPLTVKENLMSRAALYGITGNAFDKRLQELVEILDFDEFLNRPVGKLSGGQRRRIDIARALLHRPEILILDEPTTGLDPQTRQLIWNVIEKLQKTENMTVFLTTHYMEEAVNAGYVVILDRGSVAAEGTPFELKNDYVQDIVSVYGVSEDEIKTLNREYKKIRDGYQIKVKNTKEATKLIVEHQDLFTDYEVVKGGMDDVFLAVTGKKLGGER